MTPGAGVEVDVDEGGMALGSASQVQQRLSVARRWNAGRHEVASNKRSTVVRASGLKQQRTWVSESGGIDQRAGGPTQQSGQSRSEARAIGRSGGLGDVRLISACQVAALSCRDASVSPNSPLEFDAQIQREPELVVDQREDPEQGVFARRRRILGEPLERPEIPCFEVGRARPDRAPDVVVVDSGIEPPGPPRSSACACGRNRRYAFQTARSHYSSGRDGRRRTCLRADRCRSVPARYQSPSPARERPGRCC